MDEELNYPQSDSSEEQTPNLQVPNHFQTTISEPQVSILEEQQPQSPRRGRPLGVKNKALDPEMLLQSELMAMLKMAQQTRKYAEEAIQRLAEAAEGADNIKTKTQIADMLISATERLTKCSGAIIEQLKKQPGALGGDGGNEANFNFEEWIKTL
jgi:hypothetical protein